VDEKIGIVGLGYVGLPLACAFADLYDVVGYDAKSERILELQRGEDHTQEVTAEDLAKPRLSFCDQVEGLADCTFIIVAVPTPIDENHEPDLGAMEGASEAIGKVMKPGCMVVYESTVYPGVSEDICLPILERQSGMKLGEFDLGYSPERINPGDKEHGVRDIIKVVSGHSPASLARASKVYGSIIRAGIHEAPTIMTAEASKVIENVQRDLNIALMNELSKIFEKLGLHTPDVIAASATKWNFHRYHPGLVGGHCIGVDPYYLTKRAEELGYHPEVILSGRRINDGMGAYVADQVAGQLHHEGVALSSARVAVLGLTFKENVPDYRNTKAVDVVNRLQSLGVEVTACEPMLEDELVQRVFGLANTTVGELQGFDAIVLVNGHDAFKEIELSVLKSQMRTPVIFDVKNFFNKEEAKALGFNLKSL
jgi:UDP-N-acetyl-D-glucosamine/UDP-N-acetyl-D-galactosamine dehydrogenase